ncbi:MAG: class I SAM-dependent methyltransferase [Ktedonobacterales bacterium]
MAEDHRFRLVGGRRYVRGSPYLLPKDDGEMHRLDFQHYMLRYALRSNYVAPISQPHDILDVGTGTSRWALEMALAFPAANVIGVDLVAPPVDSTTTKGKQADLRTENYAFVTANILERLPFPGMSFDFVHQRLLVGALPADRWPEVIAEIVRVTRPGGWVELVEAAPALGNGPALQALTEWLVVACEKRGLDAVVGPKIGTMLQATGLQGVNYQQADLPVGRHGGRLGTLTETNLISFLTSIRGLVLSYGLTDGQHFDAALAAAQKEIARGGVIWPYFVAYGQRPI